MTLTVQKDIIILGGGVAGLWLLNRLRQENFDAILLESEALGSGQSIASQGMIHGGIKYALSGSLTGASDAIADMPAHWSLCLEGKGDVDLQDTGVLSGEYYMWPKSSFRSRLNAFLGSKALRGRVETVKTKDYPSFFKGNIKGPLYQLNDLVIDVPSLLNNLFHNQQDHIYLYDFNSCEIVTQANGQLEKINIKNQDSSREDIALSSKLFIVTSGTGSQALINKIPANQSSVAVQIRPLKMVMVKHTWDHPVYAHCISDQLSMTPEVTITTHHCNDGRKVWYLGGELAEQGVHRTDDEQIKFAQQKLAELFPWCPVSDAEWSCYPVNRAEAAQKNGKRPDTFSMLQQHNVVFCWPTKLTLSPGLAQHVLEFLESAGIKPSETQENISLPLPSPSIAESPWDTF